MRVFSTFLGIFAAFSVLSHAHAVLKDDIVERRDPAEAVLTVRDSETTSARYCGTVSSDKGQRGTTGDVFATNRLSTINPAFGDASLDSIHIVEDWRISARGTT
ncbi:hypothetical protein N0V90_007846 [Kalmusia sp. IMI 367209]|nr:hypothetical protein N0V90_007846 [Kalmusia sp. IMI 367209]